MKEPLVSIIVPIYNIENYLSNCLYSLMRQSYMNLEIILIDDGSTDNSPLICKQFAVQDSRIHFIHQINQGVVSARINGFRYSSGSLITFIDGDDYVDERMIELMVAKQQQYQVDMVSCQYYDDNENGIHKSVTRPHPGYYNRKKIVELIKKGFLYDPKIRKEGVPSFLWGNLFIRSLIQPILDVGHGLIYNEDQVGKLQAFYIAKSLYVMEDFLYYYVGHIGQTMRQYNIRFWTDLPIYFERINRIDINHYLDNQIPERAYVLFKMLLKMEYTHANLSIWEQSKSVKKNYSPILYNLALKAKYREMNWKEKLQYKLIKHKCWALYGMFVYMFHKCLINVKR